MTIDNVKKNVVADKSFALALRIVKLAKHLNKEKKEYVLSKQVLRSGTAVGALIREAEHAQSKADFISKMSISLKEANETVYWLELLHQSDYMDQSAFDSIGADATEVLKLLISIVKKSRANNG
jgi:four helix bundle protein